jgi:hypothetical protein
MADLIVRSGWVWPSRKWQSACAGSKVRMAAAQACVLPSGSRNRAFRLGAEKRTSLSSSTRTAAGSASHRHGCVLIIRGPQSAIGTAAGLASHRRGDGMAWHGKARSCERRVRSCRRVSAPTGLAEAKGHPREPNGRRMAARLDRHHRGYLFSRPVACRRLEMRLDYHVAACDHRQPARRERALVRLCS